MPVIAGKRVVGYTHFTRTSDTSRSDEESATGASTASDRDREASAAARQQHPPPRRSGSFTFGTTTADGRRAADGAPMTASSSSFSFGAVQRLPCGGRQGSRSRRRARHHALSYACLSAGGSFTALPQPLVGVADSVSPAGSFCGSAAAVGPGAGTEWDDYWEEGSMCSQDSMCSMGTLASLCESATYGGPGDLPWDAVVVPEMDLEAVFMLTGKHAGVHTSSSCLA
jgi:hypothetical protein